MSSFYVNDSTLMVIVFMTIILAIFSQLLIFVKLNLCKFLKKHLYFHSQLEWKTSDTKTLPSNYVVFTNNVLK